MFIEPLDTNNKWGGMTPCEEDGSFAFSHVPVGRYKLSTQTLHPYIGKDPNAKIVIVAPGSTIDVKVRYSTGKDLIQDQN